MGTKFEILMIFSRFWEPVGSRFLVVRLFFLDLRLSILNVSSEVCFLVGLGENIMPGSVVGGAQLSSELDDI